MTYRSFSDYATERFGAKVYKVPIDAGFTCPNRDGTKGTGGCTFCRPDTFQPEYSRESDSIVDQFLAGRELFRDKNAEFFLPYFQANTNTYAPVERLESYYRSVLQFDDVVGLCIGTRPDCVDRPVVELLSQLSGEGHEIWLELGLQSSSDRVLDRVNRCHGFEAYRRAVDRLAEHDIRLCVHLMFGLPGDTVKTMRRTVRDVAGSHLDGVKFHQLQIMEGTPIADDYSRGEIEPLEYETYRDLVAWSLRTLSSDVVVHRLMADGGDDVVAPNWAESKHRLAREIRDELSVSSF